MGSCFSNKFNESIYEPPKYKKSDTDGHESPVSAGSKRTYHSRRSSKSSGIYSRCSSPYPSSFQYTPKSTPRNEIQNKEECKMDLSYGYHSEKFIDITSSSSKSKLEAAEICLTQDTSEHLKELIPTTYSTYGMELYMMTVCKNIMSNTSTPIVRRKNESYTLNDSAAALPPPSKHYREWKKVLHQRPTNMLHEVSCIPEALSGNSCPSYFPAYTYNQTVKSTTMCANPNATYILSTEL